MTKGGIHSGWSLWNGWYGWPLGEIRKGLAEKLTQFLRLIRTDIAFGPPMTEQFILRLIKWLHPHSAHAHYGIYARFILLELAVFSHHSQADLARPPWPVPFVWQFSSPLLRVQRLYVYRPNEVSVRALWRIASHWCLGLNWPCWEFLRRCVSTPDESRLQTFHYSVSFIATNVSAYPYMDWPPRPVPVLDISFIQERTLTDRRLESWSLVLCDETRISHYSFIDECKGTYNNSIVISSFCLRC